MMNVRDQELMFTDIAKALPRKISVYAIGGTAMMFLGIKQTTLDIDLVFSNPEERKIFKDAVKSLGYSDFDSRIVYGKKENTPEMIKMGDARLDLFLSKIITSTFSEEMCKRATQTHEFGKNLTIKIANIHDIIIMKSVTTREKDEEDISSIIKKSKVDWEIIIEEAKNQVKLGNIRAVLDLGDTMERIKNKIKADVPKSFLDKLFKVLQNQFNKKPYGKPKE